MLGATGGAGPASGGAPSGGPTTAGLRPSGMQSVPLGVGGGVGGAAATGGTPATSTTLPLSPAALKQVRHRLGISPLFRPTHTIYTLFLPNAILPHTIHTSQLASNDSGMWSAAHMVRQPVSGSSTRSSGGRRKTRNMSYSAGVDAAPAALLTTMPTGGAWGGSPGGAGSPRRASYCFGAAIGGGNASVHHTSWGGAPASNSMVPTSHSSRLQHFVGGGGGGGVNTHSERLPQLGGAGERAAARSSAVHEVAAAQVMDEGCCVSNTTTRGMFFGMRITRRGGCDDGVIKSVIGRFLRWGRCGMILLGAYCLKGHRS